MYSTFKINPESSYFLPFLPVLFLFFCKWCPGFQPCPTDHFFLNLATMWSYIQSCYSSCPNLPTTFHLTVKIEVLNWPTEPFKWLWNELLHPMNQPPLWPPVVLLSASPTLLPSHQLYCCSSNTASTLPPQDFYLLSLLCSNVML